MLQMKILLLFSLMGIFITCNILEGNKKGDLEMVRLKYNQKYNKALSSLIADTMNYPEQEQFFHKMKFIFQETFPADSVKMVSDFQKMAAVADKIKDSMDWDFFKAVLDLPKNHPALHNGKIGIQDSANRYILSYTSTKEKEQLLTILNMDEDNRAFVGDFDFPNLELLICNYDVYLSPPPLKSLALRPFEARIYKIK